MDQELARTLSDIVRRIDRLSPIVLPATRIAAQPGVEPYWYCERGNTLAALSGDWDEMFDAEASVLVPFRYYSTGHLPLIGSSTTFPVRGVLRVSSENDCEIQAIVHTAGNNVQLKVNGEYTDYVATTAVNLNLRQGENFIRFAHDGAAGIASLEAEFFVEGVTFIGP